MLWLLIAALLGCVPVVPDVQLAERGVLDLRDWNPDDGPIRLSGDWLFDDGALVPPERPLAGLETLAVPESWVDAGRDRVGHGTYGVTLLLPVTQRELAVRVQGVGGAGRAWIGDTELPPMGVVSEHPDTVWEDPRSSTARFEPDEEIELRVQVANLRHRSGGLRKSVLLADAEHMQALREHELAFDIAVVTALMTMGLGFGLVFLYRPRERTFLGFAATCLLLATRHGFTGAGDLLLTFGPAMDWPLRLRLEYLTAPLSMMAGYVTVLLLAGADPRHRAHKAVLAMCLFVAAAVLTSPTDRFGNIFQALLFVQLVVGVGAVSALVAAARNGRPEAWLILVGLLVFLAGQIYDQQALRGGWVPVAGELATPAFLLMLFIQGATVVLNFTLTLRLNERLTAASLRFVPQDVLRLLNRADLSEARRGDQVRLTMDVLFCDIRGYTTIAESMGPEALFPTLNRYHAHMEPPISAHGGFVSQYLGDGIMALFHGGADEALTAAIEMAHAVERFNAGEQGTPEFRIGMGMSSGEVTLGILGSPERLDSNIVGDPANAASRIEGMTKRYGGVLLIDDTVANRLTRSFGLRALDRVIPKGKTKPVTLYEVMDALPEDERARRVAGSGAFAAALALYRDRETLAATVAFQAVLDADPSDRAAALYLERLNQDDLPTDWDGVHSLDWK